MALPVIETERLLIRDVRDLTTLRPLALRTE
jgi:hypothetical protein